MCQNLSSKSSTTFRILDYLHL